MLEPTRMDSLKLIAKFSGLLQGGCSHFHRVKLARVEGPTAQKPANAAASLGLCFPREPIYPGGACKNMLENVCILEKVLKCFFY